VESRHQSDQSHPSSTDSKADSNEASPDKQTTLCLLNEALPLDFLQFPFSPPPTGSSAPRPTLPYSSYFDILSPPSASSTDIVTPTDEHPQMRITVAGNQHLTDDIDLASLFMLFPDLLACDEGPGHVDPRSMKYHHEQFLDGHCGCLNEVTNYNIVLELSLRLRKAADVLSHSANHHFNNGCPLNQRIVDVDAFAT
jgi:hypothetical protein